MLQIDCTIVLLIIDRPSNANTSFQAVNSPFLCSLATALAYPWRKKLADRTIISLDDYRSFVVVLVVISVTAIILAPACVRGASYHSQLQRQAVALVKP